MKRYITGFNGLRTFGVLAIILYHISPNVFQGGFLGVVLFFVLSGYLITDSLLREYDANKKINIFKFWSRRLKRLYPALVAVFVVVTPYFLFFQQNLLKGLREEFFSSILSIQNWWQIQQGSSYFVDISGESPFKHLYYLSIEGQFLLIWPLGLWLLLKFVKSRSKLFFISCGIAVFSLVLMAVLFVPGSDPTRVYYGTDTRLFSLMMGAALAFVWPMDRLSSKINQRGRRFGTQLTVTSFLLLLLAYFFMPATSAFTYYGGMGLVSILSVLLVALIAHPALSANRFFTNPIFNYVGSRAYGIYLWQLPVFALAQAKLLYPNAWYQLLWQIVLILILAECSYRFVEIPGEKFDYSDIPNQIHLFVTGGKWKTREKVIKSAVVIAFLAIFSIILFSPASPHDQEILQKKIMAQQLVLQKQQEQKANDRVSRSLKKLAQKYHVQPIEAEKASQMKVLALGDSVMVAGSTDLKEMFPLMTFSAAVGNQVQTGLTFLEAHPSEVKKSDALLVGLGTNGLLTAGNVDYVEKIMQQSAGKPVYWINIQAPDRPWVPINNKQLSQEAKKYSNLTIINWAETSKNNKNWFYSDLIHPNENGALHYTALITQNLVKTKN